MPVIRLILIIATSFTCVISIQTAAHAQDDRGTLQQQLACTPDVFRLCGEQIPDANRIVACLRQNTPQLSEACRTVFESNASAPPASAQQTAPVRRGDLQRRYDDQ
jgi:hypothetical protein